MIDSEKQGAVHVPGYWWLNAKPGIWSFSDVGIGEVQSYTLYNENGHKRRVFQNFLDAKAGDLVIGYESYPVKQVVALAKIIRENDGEKLYFEKIENVSVPIDYATLRACPELEHMEYFVNPQGSLFKLTEDEYDFIMDLIREANPAERKQAVAPFSKEDFLKEVYMSGDQYDTLISLLEHRQNLILQGAPGVGKTFAARRLAYAMMGEKDDSRIEFIQFHQSYSYEDFIMGYRPRLLIAACHSPYRRTCT
ncbi:AAA family ATPase [Sporolactobacillus sp. KGMB 08714]|uniref:AAA family ATPase n=1 Tax=Sporolactobacillus sp. KGMB 08714 TaxID=3064704 RepID=UPI002FBDCD36